MDDVVTKGEGPGRDTCVGCGRELRTGDVEFTVERHGHYHFRCSKDIPGDATISGVGVFVEARHLQRMPGSARKRLERASLLVPGLVRALKSSGKIDGVTR